MEFFLFFGINLVISSSNSIFEAINIKKKIKTHNTPKLSSFLESINWYMIKKLLIYNSGGGIGDSIQILNLIETIKKEFTNTNIY